MLMEIIITIACCVAVYLVVSRIVKFGESRRQQVLLRRKSFDWSTVALEQTGGRRRAVDIVVGTIANCFRVPMSRIYPDDDVNESYSFPVWWHVITIDDPGSLIFESISEELEKIGAPWEYSTCGTRVDEIISSVAHHLEDCFSKTE